MKGLIQKIRNFSVRITPIIGLVGILGSCANTLEVRREPDTTYPSPGTAFADYEKMYGCVGLARSRNHSSSEIALANRLELSDEAKRNFQEVCNPDIDIDDLEVYTSNRTFAIAYNPKTKK